MTQIYDPVIGGNSESGLLVESKTKKTHGYDPTYVQRCFVVWLAFRQ